MSSQNQEGAIQLKPVMIMRCVFKFKVAVIADSHVQVCAVCNEPFEQFWEEVEESWHLRDAIRINGGKVL